MFLDNYKRDPLLYWHIIHYLMNGLRLNCVSIEGKFDIYSIALESDVKNNEEFYLKATSSKGDVKRFGVLLRDLDERAIHDIRHGELDNRIRDL